MPDRDDQVAALRATAHPLRLRMLSALTASPMSAAELARELGTTQANASYHLRVLLEAGEVEPAGEVSVRGGRAKRYRHAWDSPDRSRQPEEAPDRLHLFRAMASEMTRRAELQALAGRGMLADAEMWVPVEVWEQAVDHLVAASALVHDHARPARTEATVHVNLQLVAFPMREPS